MKRTIDRLEIYLLFYKQSTELKAIPAFLKFQLILTQSLKGHLRSPSDVRVASKR